MVTIESPMSMDNDVPLLHADRDFGVIARVTLLQAKNVLA